MNIFMPNLSPDSFYKIKAMLDGGTDPVMVPKFMAHCEHNRDGLYVFPLEDNKTAYCVIEGGVETDCGIEDNEILRSRYLGTSKIH